MTHTSYKDRPSGKSSRSPFRTAALILTPLALLLILLWSAFPFIAEVYYFLNPPEMPPDAAPPGVVLGNAQVKKTLAATYKPSGSRDLFREGVVLVENQIYIGYTNQIFTFDPATQKVSEFAIRSTDFQEMFPVSLSNRSTTVAHDGIGRAFSVVTISDERLWSYVPPPPQAGSYHRAGAVIPVDVDEDGLLELAIPFVNWRPIANVATRAAARLRGLPSPLEMEYPDSAYRVCVVNHDGSERWSKELPRLLTTFAAKGIEGQGQPIVTFDVNGVIRVLNGNDGHVVSEQATEHTSRHGLATKTFWPPAAPPVARVIVASRQLEVGAATHLQVFDIDTGDVAASFDAPADWSGIKIEAITVKMALDVDPYLVITGSSTPDMQEVVIFDSDNIVVYHERINGASLHAVAIPRTDTPSDQLYIVVDGKILRYDTPLTPQ